MMEYVEQTHPQRWKQICFFLLLVVSLLFQLLVPTNPDNILPLLPECLSLLCLVTACVFVFSEKNVFSLSKGERFFLILIVLHHVLVLTPRAFFAFKNIPYQQWIPCASLGPSVVRQECFFHSAYNHHFALRQWSTISFAMVFGSLVFVLTRTHRWASTAIYSAMMLVAAGISILSIAGYLGRHITILPDWIYVNNYGNFRSTQIFANPSWTWPYLLAGLLASYFLVLTSEIKMLRVLAVFGAGFANTGIFLTQQRGGLVIVAVSLIYCLIMLFRRRSVFSYVVLLLFFSAIFWILRQPDLILGGTWQKASDSMISSERMRIWSAALDTFKLRPWFGFGYASWFAVVSFLGRTEGFAEVFPTAHNLFVQIFVELGAIEGTFICALLVFGFCLLIFRAHTAKLKLFIVFSTVAFLLLVLVQEVDYIRPTFYVHSFFWSTLFGALALNKPGVFSFPLQKKPTFIFLGGLAALQIAIAFYVYNRWSRGAYAFEASASHANTPITRWLYKEASLPVYVQHNFAYRIHPIHFIENAGAAAIKGPSEQYEVTTISGETSSVVMINENQNKLVPSRYEIKFQNSVPIGTQNVSAKVEYLQFDSNLAIYWSQGLLGWQRRDEVAGRMCLNDCVFIAASCRRNDQLSFSVSGISSANNRPTTKVAIDYATISPKPVLFSRQLVENVQNLGFQTKAVEVMPLQRESVTLPGNENGKYFWIRIQSTDPVFVGDSSCE